MFSCSKLTLECLFIENNVCSLKTVWITIVLFVVNCYFWTHYLKLCLIKTFPMLHFKNFIYNIYYTFELTIVHCYLHFKRTQGTDKTQRLGLNKDVFVLLNYIWRILCFIMVHWKELKKNYQRSIYKNVLWLHYCVCMPNLKQTCIHRL